MKSALTRVLEKDLRGKGVIVTSYAPKWGGLLRGKPHHWALAIPALIGVGTDIQKILDRLDGDQIEPIDVNNAYHITVVNKSFGEATKRIKDLCESGVFVNTPDRVWQKKRGLLRWLVSEKHLDRELSGTLIIMINSVDQETRDRFLNTMNTLIKSGMTRRGGEASTETLLGMNVIDILTSDLVGKPDESTRVTGIALPAISMAKMPAIQTT